MRLSLTALLMLGTLLWTAPPTVAQGVGDPAPDFTFMTLESGELSLSDFSGKVVFLFLLGNQCPFCLAVGYRTEEEINKVFAPGGGFQAIGLDLWDSSSSVATMAAFKNRTGITYPLCLKAGSIAGQYSTTYDRVIVIDQAGFIRYKGASQVANTLNAAREVISSLLGTTTAVEDEALPERFALDQNYPNPFGLGPSPSTTTISYELPAQAHVDLRVYDVLGREVRALVSGPESAGLKTVAWDGTAASGQAVPSGLYVYTLKAETFTLSRTMMLIK